ncbi:MAG: DUF4906 domain-containing protein [Odoribacter splanchnicus]
MASDACQAYFTGLSANFRIVRRLISANAIRRLGRMLAARDGGRAARYRQNLPVSIRVECPDMSVVSKSLNTSQEKQIRDLNLYLYHETNPEADRHIYSDAVSGPLMTELVAGSYTLYAVANAGNDMGKLPETGISAYYFPVSSENSLEKNGVLLSSVRMEFTVNRTMTLPVSLRHNVSKISLNLSTAASFSGFTIRSIRMLSVPKGMSVFADNGASAVTETFDYPKRTVGSRTYAGIFYLPENLQGVVSKITDQRDKNLQNAPARATCILIEGDKDGRAIYYRIYPGENNTSDFNIRRNRHYTINATIQGKIYSTRGFLRSRYRWAVSRHPAMSAIKYRQRLPFDVRAIRRIRFT